MQDHDLITGIIPSEEKTIFFALKESEHLFCFTTNEVYSLKNVNKSIELQTEDGFLIGKTHNNHQIAIYVGSKTFLILNARYLRTSTYVISKSNVNETSLEKFDGIKFVGGTLNRLFSRNSMEREYTENGLQVKAHDDTRTYDIKTKEFNITLSIYSTISEKYSVENGNSISNSDVQLTLEFEQKQSLYQLFYHYNRIRDIIAFMTFRYNVGFSGIELLNHNKEFDFLEEVACVCIEQDFELTKKSYLQNICFEDLDDAIPELFRIFYDSENRKPSYSLGFFPENDNKINHMSDSKIREICSGVECELNFVKDIELEENKLLNELVQQVKNTVKIFRKDNPGLEDSVYSFISGNIKFWTLPAAEKICALFHKYDEEMLILNQSAIIIDDDAIKAFVKYRNDITHGSHRVLDVKIAITAHCLERLVYCCLLERIGVERSRILEWCKDKILR